MNPPQIEIQITDQPIPGVDSAPPGCGAFVTFQGIVRDKENGARIAALEYEAYRPMAELEMRRIVSELLSLHPCVSVRVIHRIGVVPVGEAAIVLHVGAKHRAEAFALAGAFMDRLKQDVPIWKVRAIPA